ncbi:hypothetical protein CCR95_03235 [Thiocystis minor]|uniref:sigma factor-like helix-turn-helix DNA-binding protein n=1 Tax=Thiocystis minor TaxID=61597 RepID=UPI001913AEE3|nr:sigma factor-like helix-turn-helix DNA-binding protein [Thiocystis minor]MBK5963130.1 hypothetical protein [Thiocystis minor]
MPPADRCSRPGETLDAVAAPLGMTRKRVRQIELQALNKCRQWCNEQGWMLDDLVRDAAVRMSSQDGCAQKRAGIERAE